MKDKLKQRKILIIALAVILTLSVGYAIISESLNISGSASTGSTNFNIVFDRVGNIREVEASGTKADIKESGKKLEINVPGLSMPTSYAVIPVTIKNKGDITAKVKEIKVEGLDTTDIKVTYDGLAKEDIFNPNDEKEVNIKVVWDASSTSTSVEASFSIEIVYEQVTGSTTTTAHDDSFKVGYEFCLDTECFYTIKDNGDTVTALAKYNLYVGNIIKVKDLETFEVESITPIEEEAPGYGKQSESSKGVILTDLTWVGTNEFSKEAYWEGQEGGLLPEYGTSYPADVYDENSSQYKFVKNYETYLRDSLNKKSVVARLLSYKELEALGCSFDSPSCLSAPSFVYGTSYWAASAGDALTNWVIGSNGNLGKESYARNDLVGIRPVITISKSEI